MNDRPQMEAAGGPRVCFRCGKLVSPDDLYCISCGSDLKAPPVPGQAGAADPGDFQASRQVNVPPGTNAYPPSGALPPPDYGGYYYQPPPAYPGYPTPQRYPAPYYSPGYTAKKTDEMAVISLICALGSFIIFPFFPAIAAIILGFMSKDRIKKDPMILEGEGLAMIGIVLGIANLVFVLAVVVAIAIIAASQASMGAIPLVMV
jgi:hypothetical protein